MKRPKIIRRLNAAWFLPRSQAVDDRRHEFILNILLGGLLAVGIFAFLASVAALAEQQNFNGLQSIVFTTVFLLIMAATRWAVWRGKLKTASYILIVLLTLAATELTISWGFMLAQALLVYIMVIVVAGILLGARAGIVWTGITAFLLLGIAFDQTHGYIKPDLSWRGQSPVLIDALGYAFVFCIIGLVSWLSNREIDNSLKRARRSEAELLVERDNLEIKVAERTQELERLQLMRIMELERFAAFGKVSAALVHELSSPLMAATLSLQNARITGESRLDRVNKSLAQIERHLQAARMQLRGGSILTTFSVGKELQQVADMVQPIARRKKVKLEISKPSQLKLHGDAVKFSQIISNLLVNAVESYAVDAPAAKRTVRLGVSELKNGLKLEVRDHGSGISEADMLHIFEPFYSKKPTPEEHSGMGIGLGIVKRFVEEDFDGKLAVTSSPKSGTKFSVTLYSRHRDGRG